MPAYQPVLRGVARSIAYAEAVASGRVDVPVLYTFEITHPDLATPLRLVLNDADITATLEADAPVDPGAAVVFTAMQLGLQLPDESDSTAAPQTRVWIDGVSPLVAQVLEPLASSLQPVAVALRPYVGNDLSGPAVLPPLRLQATGIEIGIDRVSAALTFADSGNTRFPRKVFTPDEHPGLGAR